MHASTQTARLVGLLRFATIILIVAVLAMARDVILPLIEAIVMVILLSPMVRKLRSWGLPRAASIIAIVSVAFSALGLVGWLVTDQAIRLGKQLPGYERNLQQKVALLKQPHAPASLTDLANMMEKVSQEITAPAPGQNTDSDGSAVQPKAVPVELRTRQSPLEMFREVLLPIIHPLTKVGIVIVLVIATLFQWDDLRERFKKVLGVRKTRVAVRAAEDISRRLSRYLGTQLLVNAGYGVPIGVGLFLIGVPNAALWAFMAIVLRFIPYLGAWIAALFPLLLAIAVDPGWTKLLYTMGLFLTMELISSNLVEVVLYSASTGISNLALLVAAVFWTWLWGIEGLALSTPLTVCLLVIGKYVPGIRALSMLLGNETVPAIVSFPPKVDSAEARLSA